MFREENRIFEAVRFKAFILSLCTVFYLVEYAATPRIMASSKCMEVQQAAAGSCCQKGMGGGKHCAKPGDHCPKPEKGCHPQSDCCLNCPLCYVMLMTDPTGPVRAQPALRHYATFVASYVYLYHSSCWKPPNAA